MLVELGALTSLAASVIVLLGATPAAVSTFSLAQNEGVGAETVASIVLWSSVISMATLPVWATVVESIW